jgi:hypothetical protein
MRSHGLIAVVVLVSILAVSAFAQISGAPASVTSYGFGGHAFPNAPRASVTSLGPNGYGTPPLPIYMGPRFTTGPTVVVGGHHHNHTYPFYPVYYSYYPVMDPYVYSGPMEAGPAPSDEEEYQGGPTIFDRRGSGNRSAYEAPREQASVEPPAPRAASTEAAPEEPQPATILVFKDGHKQEVTNYAIVGANLFDLSQGHRQKIAIADLDVQATQKANEDEGIEFKLPALPSGS